MIITSMLGASTGTAVSLLIVGLLVGCGAGFVVAHLLAKKQAKQSAQSASKIIEKAMNEAASVKKEAIAEASTIRREAMMEVKEETSKLRMATDSEVRERKTEVQKSEQRANMREEQIAKREEVISNKEMAIEATRAQVENTKKQVEKNLEEAKARMNVAIEKLEVISGMTKVQAKKEIIESLVDEAKDEAAAEVRRVTNAAEEESDKRAREILTTAIQRLSTDVVSEVTVSNVALPNDDVKGKLIGKEGRNIRAIEAATGVELVVDDTPGMVQVSSFDPYRREVARLSIEKLLLDGRVHPGRIEEVVEKIKKEIDTIIRKSGEEMLYDLKIHGMNPEMVKLIGRMKYRSSYGQNLYTHSKEVALLSRMIASQFGADEQIALRAGLLHDVGKVLDHEMEGTHVQIGVEMAKKYKENGAVIHAIEAHHGDVPFETIEAVIVQVADAISSSRPGARRENLEAYVKRLRDLEQIAMDKKGVASAFAISAGREIRIIVRPDQVSDSQALFMAREIAKEVEEKLTYPGQIKVNVIRETRTSATAK